MKLQNETAIITGATSGIGRKMAELFLKEGCKVAICSRSKEKVKETLSEFKEKYGDSVIGFPCDVNKTEDLENLVDKTINTFGSIRILVANAGVNTLYGPFECLTPEMVESNAKIIIGANLIGVMNSIAAVLPIMNKQKYGRIITLSGAGADRPIDNMTLYSASKGGVVSFSKCLALELAEKEEDIKINIFQPGMLKTNLMTSFVCVPNWKTDEEIKDDLDFTLQYLGGDIEKSCGKVFPYVTPECKSNGKIFRGFKLSKLIIQAIKMKRKMMKRKK